MTTILVVEDDQDIRFLLSETVSDLGYDVLEAADGGAGFRSAIEEHPDVPLNVLQKSIVRSQNKDSVGILIRKQGNRRKPVFKKRRNQGLDLHRRDVSTRPGNFLDLLIKDGGLVTPTGRFRPSVRRDGAHGWAHLALGSPCLVPANGTS